MDVPYLNSPRIEPQVPDKGVTGELFAGEFRVGVSRPLRLVRIERVQMACHRQVIEECDFNLLVTHLFRMIVPTPRLA
jgi:hypothetical protein